MSTDVSHDTRALCTRVDEETAAKIEAAAEECGVSISAYLRTVTEEHVKRNPQSLNALSPDSLEEFTRRLTE